MTMETLKAKDARMETVLATYDLQTPYFSRVLEGISDDDAHQRLGTKANHIAWLSGSLVQQRYELANLLGLDKKPRSNELFNDFKGIQDEVTYPSLEQYREDWNLISLDLRSAIQDIGSEKLATVLDMGEMQMTYFEMIYFTMYREANCIGQIALWRRLLGYAPMKYD